MQLNLSVLSAPVAPVRSNKERELAVDPEILVAQGFAGRAPVAPVAPVQKGKLCARTAPPGRDQAANDPGPSLPNELARRVDTITAREGWLPVERAEWLDMLRQQIERDGVPVAELVACLDAHLAKHPHRVRMKMGRSPISSPAE